MATLTISKILELAGLDVTKRIKLVRHKASNDTQEIDGKPAEGNPYDWYVNDRQKFIAYQSEQTASVVFGDKNAPLLPTIMTGAKCDFIFTVMPRKEDVVVMVDYCTDLYKEQTISKFVNSFKQMSQQKPLIVEKSAIKDTPSRMLAIRLQSPFLVSKSIGIATSRLRGAGLSDYTAFHIPVQSVI